MSAPAVTSRDDHVMQVALERGLVTPACLATARLKVAEPPGDATSAPSLVEILAAEGALDEAALASAVVDKWGMPYVVLSTRQITPEVLARLPPAVARLHHVMPFAQENGRLWVAVAAPATDEVLESLGFVAGTAISPALASTDDIHRALVRYYGREQPGTGALARAMPPGGTTPTAGSAQEGPASEPDAPLIRLVQAIIHEAIRRRASDIHFEPLARRFRVRYRIDGVLVEVEAPPQHLHLALISRLKIMANLSIAEKRLPQDGRIQIAVADGPLDLRVSSLPTAHGESIVLRILDQKNLKLSLPELGFLTDDQREFERLIAFPDGIFLATGPTGSGKTTTLYAALQCLNRPDRKIITVEDPVEYQLAGINQVAVNASIGLTFATALRAMLRQAPNIIMVGEIRDRETAEVALHASLTGHLVCSTLHTNDAPTAVTRLIDLGAKPFLLAAALRAVLAQRLVRRICPQCRCAYTPAVRELHALGLTSAQLAGANFLHGAGCEACQGTGYHGRLGLFEIFLVPDEIRSMIYDNVTAVHLRQQARRNGMRTLREDGIRKMLAGLTTIEEVVAATVGGEL